MSDCGDADEGGSSSSALDTKEPKHPKEQSLQVEYHKPGPNEISIKLYRMTSEEMKQFCVKLESPDCAVEILRLAHGMLSERCCSALTSALEANPSFLRELHLTDVRFPDQTKLHLLCDALGNQHCRIRTLRIVNCGLWGDSCARLSDAIKRNPSHLKELDVSVNELGDLGMSYLCDGLMDESCRFERLKIVYCDLSGDSFARLRDVIKRNPSHLKELDVSKNRLGDVEMSYLCDGLMDESCRLERLKIVNCDLSGDSFARLRDVIKRNPSHLKELDVSKNILGDVEMSYLCDGLMDESCRLESLKIVKCGLRGASCALLSDAIKRNPSHLKELDVSVNRLGDLGMSYLCDGLMDESCRLKRLKIVNCDLSGDSCARLRDVIKRNPSHLKELDVSENILGDVGMSYLCDGLMDESCRLERLKIVKCGLRGASCALLSDAIKRNPSHLKELDVSVNELGDLGMSYLCDGLMDESCRLERLKLTSCHLSGQSCNNLNNLLMSSSCRLQELDLSHNSLRDQGIECLSVGLSSPNCKLSILRLAHCKVTDEGCHVLIDALKKSPVPLVELDLQGNDFSFEVTTMLNELKISSGIGEILRVKTSLLRDDSRRFSEYSSLSVSESPGKERPLKRLRTELSTEEMLSGAAATSGQDLQDVPSKLPATQSSSCPSAEEESHLKLDSSRGNTQLEEPEVDKAPSCFTFEVFDEPGSISYRFRGLGPGVFLCPLTGLGFTMTGGGELLYKIIEWDEDLLQASGKLPAGPLFKIEGTTKAVSQLHLLHCELNPAALPNGLSAVHMSDEGMSFLEPLEINDTHVVVDVSHFSVYGLVINFLTGILNIQRPISSQALLFHCPTWTEDIQKVNVFLLPNNVPPEEVKSQQRNSEYIQATSSCELIGRRTYTLQCPESTLVQPRLGSRFDSSFGKVLHPNFEIRLTRETKDATVMVKYQDDTVWEYIMKLTGSEPTTTPRLPDGSGPDSGTQDRQEPMKRKLFGMREGFIDRISKPNLDSLMTRLLREDVINEQEYHHLNIMPDFRVAAKALIDMVLTKNEDARGKMIEEFSKIDKHLYADLNN